MKVAISGKGGVGKTTISAGLVRHFASSGFRVYAVDADPDLSLGEVLGLSGEETDAKEPIVEMRDVIASRTGGGGALFSLNPQVDDLLDRYAVRLDNVFFFKMGAVKQGGSSCYCRENSVLNALVGSLLLDKKEVVVLDMGAGIEHLTRGTARGVDVMLVVSEPSKVSVHTARVVQRLAGDLGVRQVKFIGNKVRRPEEEKFLRDSFSGEELLGCIPFHEEVWASSMGSPEQGLSQVEAAVGGMAGRLFSLLSA